MSVFALINPEKPPLEAQFLLRCKQPTFPTFEYFFFLHKRYLIIYRQELHRFPKTGETEWTLEQSEFPLAIVSWVPWALENKFFKGPSEGGIPAGSIKYRDTVDGEPVLMNRSANPPGYRLVNMSRYSHINGRSYQQVQLTDQWLFDDGLLDQFKEWSRQYEAGQL